MAEKSSSNYNDKSPYSTYTRIADIAHDFSSGMAEEGSHAETISDIIGLVTSLAKIKDVMAGKKLTNKDDKDDKGDKGDKGKKNTKSVLDQIGEVTGKSKSKKRYRSGKQGGAAQAMGGAGQVLDKISSVNKSMGGATTGVGSLKSILDIASTVGQGLGGTLTAAKSKQRRNK